MLGPAQCGASCRCGWCASDFSLAVPSTRRRANSTTKWPTPSYICRHTAAFLDCTAAWVQCWLGRFCRGCVQSGRCDEVCWGCRRGSDRRRDHQHLAAIIHKCMLVGSKQGAMQVTSVPFCVSVSNKKCTRARTRPPPLNRDATELFRSPEKHKLIIAAVTGGNGPECTRTLKPGAWTDADWMDTVYRMTAYGHPTFHHMGVYTMSSILRGGPSSKRLLTLHSASAGECGLHNKITTTAVNVAKSHWFHVHIDWTKQLVLFGDPGPQFPYAKKVSDACAFVTRSQYHMFAAYL